MLIGATGVATATARLTYFWSGRRRRHPGQAVRAFAHGCIVEASAPFASELELAFLAMDVLDVVLMFRVVVGEVVGNPLCQLQYLVLLLRFRHASLVVDHAVCLR